jgi:hypothetical protein
MVFGNSKRDFVSILKIPLISNPQSKLAVKIARTPEK